MQQVVYAWNYLQWGGAQTYFLSLIRTVREHYDILIILPEGSNRQLLKFIEDEGVRYEFFSPSYDAEPQSGFAPRLRARWRKIKSEAAMLRKLGEQDLRSSIVHVELAPWYSLYSLVWLALRTRVFITMHNALESGNPLRRFHWKVKLRIMSRFRNFHVFASNEHCKQGFRGLYSDDLHDRIEVTYTNVTAAEIERIEAEKPDPDEVRESYGLPKDKFLVFCVGQFIDRKGRWVFLEAAKKTRTEAEDLAFVWIANSPPSTADLDRAAEVGLGEDFILITSDRVGDQHIDLMRLLSSADAFVLASYVEGLPISLLEAMALGIPAISTNVFAIPEALKDGETGILIEAGDADALAAAIVRLKKDSEMRSRLSENGRDYVMANFTDREVGKIALARYQEAFSRD